MKQKTKEIDELTEQLKTEQGRLEETKSQLLLTEQNLATLRSEKVSVHVIWLCKFGMPIEWSLLKETEAEAYTAKSKLLEQQLSDKVEFMPSV